MSDDPGFTIEPDEAFPEEENADPAYDAAYEVVQSGKVISVPRPDDPDERRDLVRKWRYRAKSDGWLLATHTDDDAGRIYFKKGEDAPLPKS